MVGAAVSVLVMVVVVMMWPGVVVFLIEGRRIGWTKTFPLFLSLLQDTSVRQRTQPTEKFAIHLSPSFLFTIKGALLFALLTGLGRSIFLLRVSTSLTLGPNKGCNYITVLAGFWCSKLFDILGTLFADSVCFAFLLELWSAVCALDDWMCNTTLLAQLLALRQFLKGVPLVTLGTGVQSRRSHPRQNNLRAKEKAKSCCELILLTKLWTFPVLSDWGLNLQWWHPRLALAYFSSLG